MFRMFRINIFHILILFLCPPPPDSRIRKCGDKFMRMKLVIQNLLHTLSVQEKHFDGKPSLLTSGKGRFELVINQCPRSTYPHSLNIFGFCVNRKLGLPDTFSPFSSSSILPYPSWWEWLWLCETPFPHRPFYSLSSFPFLSTFSWWKFSFSV